MTQEGVRRIITLDMTGCSKSLYIKNIKFYYCSHENIIISCKYTWDHGTPRHSPLERATLFYS